MRKAVLCVLFLLVATIARADRVEELRTEAQELLQRKNQYAQVMQNIDIRLLEIQGALKELTRPNTGAVDGEAELQGVEDNQEPLAD